MTDRPTHRPGSSTSPAAAALGLVLAGAAALVVSAVLVLWVADQVTSTRLWRVEDVVGPLVVVVGALAGTWVGTSSLVAGTCAAVRAAGGAWRGGEVAVQRWAPGLVRRALAVAVAAGVGVTGAAGAHAAVEAPPAATAVTVDLGWTPTAADPSAPPAAADTVPPASGSTPSPTALPTLPDTGADAHVGTADVPDDVPASGGAASVPDDVPAPAPPDAAGTSTDLATASVVVPVAAELPTASGPTPPASAPPAPAAPASGTVEVRHGDTLWALAARSLGPDASDAAIAAEWPRWYAANASTIGPDPDVLRPGQVLVVPTSVDGGTR